MGTQNIKQIETNIMFALSLLRAAPVEAFSLQRQRGGRAPVLQCVVNILEQSPFFAAQINLKKVSLPQEGNFADDGFVRAYDDLGAIEVYLGEGAYQRYLAARGGSTCDQHIFEVKGDHISDRDLVIERLERSSQKQNQG